MNKIQILKNVIRGLIEIPMPRSGKVAGEVISAYLLELREAHRLARMVMYSDDLNDMRRNYKAFDNYIETVKRKVK